jgi:O-methyltransferase involved in polyketide biosynthesis
LDVPVVAEELQAMFEGLGIERNHPTDVGGDATNAASLRAAADMQHGRVLVSCEGLMQYLSKDEFEQFLGGVREVLLKHGGVWVTSDMGVDYEVFATACMSSPDAAELYHAARRQTMASAMRTFASGARSATPSCTARWTAASTPSPRRRTWRPLRPTATG